ncbi:centriolin-like protein [Lates japonicus]|uniref:Centriolin-like protein n=1 Tax=Lates japonicus TaxID=270547 RepID=A0AAD3NLH4_LATJO|nr:centriolin-like protein [Lates japonicus]
MDVDELKVSQDKFMAEVEREKYKVLHEDLEKLRTSYQEVNQRYEADVLTASPQADYLQRELENQIKTHKEVTGQALNG